MNAIGEIQTLEAIARAGLIGGDKIARFIVALHMWIARDALILWAERELHRLQGGLMPVAI